MLGLDSERSESIIYFSIWNVDSRRREMTARMGKLGLRLEHLKAPGGIGTKIDFEFVECG